MAPQQNQQPKAAYKKGHKKVQRLSEQLPGWIVWTTVDTLGVCWHAAPAPAETPRADAFRLPNQVSAETSAKLLSLAQERYGWDDTCESCGVLARECGHRQPEREGAR